MQYLQCRVRDGDDAGNLQHECDFEVDRRATARVMLDRVRRE